MPFVLIAIGALILVTVIRGTQGQLASLLKGDFTGSNSFWRWIIAIGIIGAVGYLPKLKPVSDGFLVLVLLVLFISNRGIFGSGSQSFNGQFFGGSSGSSGIKVSPLNPLPNFSVTPGYGVTS